MTSSAYPATTAQYYKYAIYLSVFTIVYNIIEGLVSTYFGIADQTLTLFGFGIDSFIESISSIGILAMVVRIGQNPGSGKSPFEITALKVTGWSFYILSAGLIISAALSVYTGEQPRSTVWGIVIAIVSIACMLALIRYKKMVGKELDSKAMIADANCNVVCIYMSLTLLASSFLYEVFSIPYVDAVGAAGIVYFSVKEGRECFEKARSMDDGCSCEND